LIPAPDSLQKELTALERTVQSRVDQDNSFRKANANFNIQSETTQLLLAACEKLVVEKGAMDRSSFEEHSSDLAYLCKHFGTAINLGLSERYHRDKLVQMQPWSSSGGNPRPKKPRAPLFAFCCSSEFPPQQSWWTEASQRLCPDYQVLRAGKIVSSPASEVVPGDILFLRAGQRAAADGRVLVFSEGTAVDVSHITMELGDVRMITSEATAAAITASSNMVLKDSYLVSGALFCMVVRVPSTSLIPGAGPWDSEEPLFLQDATVPPGMTMSQCRNLFKQLCVRSRIVCRSFKAMVMLARVQTLVCLVTPDLMDAGSVPKLVATAKRLSRGLVLVDCGCSKSAVASLAQEEGLEHIDLSNNLDSTRTSAQPSTADPLSTGASSTGETITPSGTLGDKLQLFSTSASCASFNHLDSSSLLQHFGQGERVRLAVFAEALLGKTSQGAILSNLSQGGLTALCAILTESGNAPLYAMGTFNYPACFRQLVLSATRTDKSRMPADSLPVGPKISMVESEPSIVPFQPRASTTPTDTTGASPKAGEVPGHMSISRMASSGSQATQVTFGNLASGELDVSKLDMGKCSEVVVSLNSIGVVSEHADLVLLKSDLGCLAQALELVSKSIPASVALVAEGPSEAGC